MSEAEGFFNDLKAYVQDVTPGKMFGALCYKTPNGKSAGMFWKDHLVVKLREQDMEEAEKLEGAVPFEPSPGKKMNGWIAIPFRHKDEWVKYANLCADYVKELVG